MSTGHVSKADDVALAAMSAEEREARFAKSETATAADKCKSDEGDAGAWEPPAMHEGDAGAWPGWECPAMQDWLNWNKK